MNLTKRAYMDYEIREKIAHWFRFIGRYGIAVIMIPGSVLIGVLGLLHYRYRKKTGQLPWQ